MHPWAKRGLQSALFAGGMLMLGTGVASADDNFNPDAQPSPVDGGAAVPIQIDNNAIGTPGGQQNLPLQMNGTISTGDLLSSVGQSVGPLMGNKVVPNVAVPVQITGLSLGAAGDSHVVNDSHQTYKQGGPITTSGADTPIGGNVVAAPVVVPAGVNNLALGVLSDATVDGTATQEGEVGGPTTTSGDRAPLAGNIVELQGALPVGVNNTGAGWGGTGTANTTTEQTAKSPGSLTTSGDNGVGSANVVGAPVAVGPQVDGTGAGWGGTGTSNSGNTMLAEAGTSDAATRAGAPYITTSGDNGLASGTGLAPEVAGPVAVNCTAAGWGGFGYTDCENDLNANTGGGMVTGGNSGVGSGTAGEAPVATPVTVLGTSGAWGGMTSAISQNNVGSTAGGPVYSDGAESLGSGTIAHPQVAGPVEVNCTTGPWGGITSSDCANDYTATAGGGNATTGDGSVGSGTVADAPVALPATGNHNSAAWGGLADATGTSTIASTAGGPTYTGGDNSVAGGSAVTPAVAEPVNPSCNTGAWGGITSTSCTHEVTALSGGGKETSGNGSVVGGTVADVPATFPAEVCGTAGDWGGISTAECDNTVTSTVGGDTYDHGDDSIGGANIVGPSLAGDADVICNAGAWGGIPTSTCSNDETDTAGGFQGTSGNNAVGGGNIVDAPLATPVEVLNGAYAWGGIPTSTMTENKVITSGGPNNTNDDGGVVSSNIVSAPEAIGAQVMNIAGAWGGNPTSHGDFITKVTAGGDNAATGESGVGAGNVVTQPSALPVQVNTIGATWGGNALATGTNLTEFTSGGNNYANGDHGAITGNVVEGPIGGEGQVSSWAASWIGSAVTDADNDVTSHAGGTTNASGVGGAIAGDVIAAQLQPYVQATGQSISLMANTFNHTEDTHDLSSGGPINTNGTGGALAGDIISAEPQAMPQAMPQVYGLGISAIGSATNDVNNDLTATDGGDETTMGSGALSGVLFDVPVAADPEVYRWAVGALSTVDNHVDSTVDSDVSGTPTAATPVQIGVGLVPQVKNVVVGVGAILTNTGTDTTDVMVGRNPANVIPVELPLGNLLGGAPVAQRSARSDVPADGGGANLMQGLGQKPAEAVGEATGKVGKTSGESVGGVPGTLKGATDHSQSRAATPAAPSVPGVGDLLPHIQQPHVSAPVAPAAPKWPTS